MKTELVRIGNSRGIRIPKPLIDEARLGQEVELHVENGRLIITSQRRPRQGWKEVFMAAGSPGNDELLLDSATLHDFDRKEWRW